MNKTLPVSMASDKIAPVRNMHTVRKVSPVSPADSALVPSSGLSDWLSVPVFYTNDAVISKDYSEKFITFYAVCGGTKFQCIYHDKI